VALAIAALGAAACGTFLGPRLPPEAVTPDEPFRRHPPLGKAETPFLSPPVREGRLANGIRVLLAEDQRSPLVALSVAIARGAAVAPPGVVNLAFITLYAGTELRDRSRLASGFQALGAIGTTTLDYDGFAFHYTVLPSGRQKTLSLLAEMLQRPNLSDAEFVRDRSWLVASVEARSPKDRMDDALSAALYPPGHPYRFDPEGDEATVGAIRRADVVDFLRTQVRPDQVVIAAAGHVGWGELFGDVTNAFGAWKGEAPALPPLPDPSPPGDAPVVVMDQPGANQSEIHIAALSPAIDSPDRLPFLLLATALGGTFTSRMNLNLRERHAYGYSPHTQIETRRGSGKFSAIASVAAARTGDALGEMLIELERTRTADLASDELELAKVSFLRTIPDRFSTVRATAQTLARLAASHRPLDENEQFARELPSIGTSEIRAVAEKYLRRDRLRVVILGDATAVRPQLRDVEVEVVRLR
jgi:zinc protease